VNRTSRTIVAAKLCATIAIATVVTLAGVGTALADPIADAKAQAAKVQSQVGALTTKAEIASEEFNVAQQRYDAATKQAAASARALKKVTAQRDSLQKTLDTRATALYRQGPFGALGVLLSARTFSDFDAAYQMLTNASYRDAKTVNRLKDAKDKAEQTHTRLVAAKKTAATQQRAMASNAATVKDQLSKSKQVLAQANSQVQTLIAQQKAAEEAAARAEAARLREQARLASESSDGGGHSHYSSPADWGNPPVSGVGAKAVWYAEKQLGKPYVWAADGPNSFDCSGLTMWAYKQVGISLPHYSREQINCGKRVSKSNLQPGDLVFFGSPIHHVGMYVGGGDFIEAPYSGCDVRITKLSHRDDFAGACRPS
jgi:peptidoglycan DL-endopeptidase CwlO